MTVLAGAEGFTFGCDPEMFITDTNGEFVSAAGLIPGTKDAPFEVEDGAVQVDGLAAEINIYPVDNFDDFNGKIVSVVRQLKAMLPKGYGLSFAPVANFSQAVMDTQTEVAKQLGCDPDWNAWTRELNPVPDTSAHPNLRCAGGHLHVGWLFGEDRINPEDETHKGHGFDLARQFDWFLGAWAVQKDPDVTRRSLYGKAGACRIKPYGMEYRVLSNFWVQNKDTRRQVWNRMQEAINQMQRAEFSKSYPQFTQDMIKIINEGKTDHDLFNIMHYPLQRV